MPTSIVSVRPFFNPRAASLAVVLTLPLWPDTGQKSIAYLPCPPAFVCFFCWSLAPPMCMIVARAVLLTLPACLLCLPACFASWRLAGWLAWLFPWAAWSACWLACVRTWARASIACIQLRSLLATAQLPSACLHPRRLHATFPLCLSLTGRWPRLLSCPPALPASSIRL